MKHIGIFSNSGDVQTAINEETLVNPYVALVSGALDYDTLEPEACHLGEWIDGGEGSYTFLILDTGATAWENGVDIGTLLGVYFEGAQVDMNVRLTYNHNPGLPGFVLELSAEGGSETPNHEFYEHNSEGWDCYEVAADPDDSEAILKAEWDGTDNFSFRTAGDLHHLSMTTINPECSE